MTAPSVSTPYSPDLFACVLWRHLTPWLCSGALLAASMGPKYQVSRELDIPVGSMTIPQVGPGTKDRKMRKGPWPDGLGMPTSHGMRIGSYTHCKCELASEESRTPPHPSSLRTSSSPPPTPRMPVSLSSSLTQGATGRGCSQQLASPFCSWPPLAGCRSCA